MKKRIYYWISGKNVTKPIVSEVILNTNILLNILKAKMEPQEGFLILEFNGSEDQIKQAIDILNKYGEVEDIPKIIQKNDEACVECGACVVHCPVGAIEIKEDYSVVFDEEECIGCKNCVKVCPVKAIEVFDI